jgi:hypothetical protein
MDRETIKKSDSVHGHIIRFLEQSEDAKTLKEIMGYVTTQRTIDGKTPGNTIRGIVQRSKYIRKTIYAKYELIK